MTRRRRHEYRRPLLGSIAATIVVGLVLVASAPAGAAIGWTPPVVSTHTQTFDAGTPEPWGLMASGGTASCVGVSNGYWWHQGAQSGTCANNASPWVFFTGDLESIDYNCVLGPYTAGSTAATDCHFQIVRHSMSRDHPALNTTGPSISWFRSVYFHDFNCTGTSDQTGGSFVSSTRQTPGVDVAASTFNDGPACESSNTVVINPDGGLGESTTAGGPAVYAFQCFLGGFAFLTTTQGCRVDNIKGVGDTWHFPHESWGPNTGNAVGSPPTGSTFGAAACQSGDNCTDLPEPPPPPTPTCTTGALSADQLLQVVKLAGFPEDEWATAIAVILAESGGQVNAVNTANSNGTIDMGLFQINSVHTSYDRTRLVSEALYNARAAYHISARGTDWTPWVTFNEGLHEQFLDDAQAAIYGYPYSGTIPCRGSSSGADEAAEHDPTDDPPDDNDGGTGCGFSLNIINSLRCALEWAFVPDGDRLESNADGLKDSYRGSSAGAYASYVFGEAGELLNFPVLDECSYHLWKLPGGHTWSVCQNGQGPFTTSNEAGTIRRIETFILYIATAGIIWRTMPWNNGRGSGEPT